MTIISYFHEDDMCRVWEAWADILDWCELDSVSADCVWQYAKDFENPPHLGNIYMDITCSRIASWCEERGIESEHYINAIDSHLSVNGIAIHSLDDFIGVVGKLAKAA